MVKVKDTNNNTHELTEIEAREAVKSGAYVYVEGYEPKHVAKQSTSAYEARKYVYDKDGNTFLLNTIDAVSWVATGSHSFTKPEKKKHEQPLVSVIKEDVKEDVKEEPEAASTDYSTYQRSTDDADSSPRRPGRPSSK